MNKDYIKGMFGLAVVAVAIAFFLAYPNTTAEVSTEVASTPVTENNEVIKASLNPDENENTQTPAGQEMIDRAQEAADNQGTQENTANEDDLVIEVFSE